MDAGNSLTCWPNTALTAASVRLNFFIMVLEWGFCPRHLLAQSLKEPPSPYGVMVAQEALTLLVWVRILVGRPINKNNDGD